MNQHAFADVLRDGAERILHQIGDGEMAGAVLELRRLSMARDAQLHAELSILTNRLRGALQHVEADVRDSLEESAAVPAVVRAEDVQCHLERAVTMTEQAAHRTIDGIEACLDSCRDIRAAGTDGSMDMAAVLGAVEGVQQRLQDLVLEQAYQDLTGQLIRKVVGTLRSTDGALAELLGLAGQVERMTGFEGVGMAADAPAAEHAEVLRTQDDIDDVFLSSKAR